MSDSYDKGEVRTKKTKGVIATTLIALLKHQNFAKITVTDLCHRAKISRATFYTHFVDKYDLLGYCLKDIRIDFPHSLKDEPYENIEKTVNQFVVQYKKVIKNIMENADSETLGLLSEWIICNLDRSSPANHDGRDRTKYIVQSNFYAGGLIFYHLWQLKNNFPENTPTMNEHLYEIMKIFHEWRSETDF